MNRPRRFELSYNSPEQYFAVVLVVALSVGAVGCRHDSSLASADLHSDFDARNKQLAEQQKQIEQTLKGLEQVRLGFQNQLAHLETANGRVAQLQQQLEAEQKTIAEQRELLRKFSVGPKGQSLDEMLGMFPSPYPFGDWKPAEKFYEDCWFQSVDGVHLHAWYCKHEHPRAVLLMAHGNGGNLSHRAPLLKLWHDRYGLSAMIFDYRGFGRSEGIPSFDGILRDARAARHYLAAREGVADKDVVLLGESLGGAVAVDLAAEDGARGLVLECTFSSIRDVARSHYGQFLTSLATSGKLDALAKIGKYHGPLLECHGDSDSVVPIELARKLFAAANEPKTFVLMPGHDHNDERSDEYYKALETFIAKLPAQARNVK